MQVFVHDPCTMIAAPVQRDVDGIPKWAHCVLLKRANAGAQRPAQPDRCSALLGDLEVVLDTAAVLFFHITRVNRPDRALLDARRPKRRRGRVERVHLKLPHAGEAAPQVYHGLSAKAGGPRRRRDEEVRDLEDAGLCHLPDDYEPDPALTEHDEKGMAAGLLPVQREVLVGLGGDRAHREIAMGHQFREILVDELIERRPFLREYITSSTVFFGGMLG